MEGAAAGAIGQLSQEFDRAQFDKAHAANLRTIAASLPHDLVGRMDVKLRSRAAATGRVDERSGNLMRIEVEQVGVLAMPNLMGTISGLLVNPFIVAKVSISDAAGRTVVEDRILGLGETSGYLWASKARQLLKGTKRRNLPFLHPETGKSPAVYAANPAQLRRDFDSAVFALGEDLDAFLKEVYGTP